MTAAIDIRHIERFRSVVSRRIGLSLHDTADSTLHDSLTRRARVLGCDSERYLLQLEQGKFGTDEVRALAPDLTVGETYFFRHPEQFQAFLDTAVPQRVSARGNDRRLSILSVGCASGEEPYSLAILLKERADLEGWNVSVRGIDINGDAIERALTAHYGAWALRATDHSRRRRWFRLVGRAMVLDDEVRAMVGFDHGNLAEEDGRLWSPASYDVVFCRNVIMYLTPDCARAVIAAVSRALVDGGYLFLGHAETLRGISSDYHLRQSSGAFFYQRRTDSPCVGPPSKQAAVPRRAADATRDAYPPSWVSAIEAASARVQLLAKGGPGARPLSASTFTPERAASVNTAVDLLERERFADALAALGALPSASTVTAEVLLLRAALLTHAGKLSEAQDACRELLKVDDLNAGAHYLLALCREGIGDRSAALDHDRTAIYLDPDFAMPRLHLGMLSRRGHESSIARSELEVALVLLRREDPARILLFGGGFARDALIALCSAELAACGGST